jgi:hypothetical protein
MRLFTSPRVHEAQPPLSICRFACHRVFLGHRHEELVSCSQLGFLLTLKPCLYTIPNRNTRPGCTSTSSDPYCPPPNAPLLEASLPDYLVSTTAHVATSAVRLQQRTESSV